MSKYIAEDRCYVCGREVGDAESVLFLKHGKPRRSGWIGSGKVHMTFAAKAGYTVCSDCKVIVMNYVRGIRRCGDE